MTKLSAGSDMSVNIAIDSDGFLKDLSSWNESVAIALAASEKIDLTESHWEIIYLVRKFYQHYDHSPEMRPLVRYTREELGPDKGSSIYLLSLFPNSPAKLACKIAGLPRPVNCL